MFPLHDENPTELTPYVTIALIAVNLVVWIYFQGGGFSPEVLYGTICDFGVIPAELTGRIGEYRGIELMPGISCTFRKGSWYTLLTSIFLHGGWFHLIGNMWFLWVFGNNIEDSMGHLRFLAFYLTGGLVGGLVHIYSALDSMVPTVGASGAVSAVMGGYLILYPTVRVQTLFWFVFIIRIIAVPAWVVLIQWFILQFLYWGSGTGGEGGIAVWAHIGGFIAGLILVKPFEDRRLIERRTEEERAGGDGEEEWW